MKKLSISQFRFSYYSQLSRESQKNGIIEFLSLRYKSEITPYVWKLTPRISIFWKLSSRLIGLCNFYFAKFLIIWEINFSNGRVYSRSNTLIKFIIIYYHVSCRINPLLIFLSNLQAGESCMPLKVRSCFI